MAPETNVSVDTNLPAEGDKTPEPIQQEPHGHGAGQVETDTAGPEGAADDILAAISDNLASATSAAKGDDWQNEPLRNFELDAAGKVKLRKNGQPVRKPGKPRKPRPGDLLANGEIYQGDGKPPAKLVTRIEGDNPAGGESGKQRICETGAEFGQVIADWIFGWAETLFGERAKPLPPEKKVISDALAGAAEGRRVPWMLMAVVGLAAYAGRLILANRKSKPKPETEESNQQHGKTDAHLHRGPNPERQNHPGQSHHTPRFW